LHPNEVGVEREEKGLEKGVLLACKIYESDCRTAGHAPISLSSSFSSLLCYDGGKEKDKSKNAELAAYVWRIWLLR